MLLNMQYWEEDKQWTSGSSTNQEGPDAVTIMNYKQKHTELLEETQVVVMKAFSDIRTALMQMELDTQKKLIRIQQDQEDTLSQYEPSSTGLMELKENIKKVRRSLETLGDHANNLSHIKLTLARLASLVSPIGSLVQLVVPSTRANSVIDAPQQVAISIGNKTILPEPAKTARSPNSTCFVFYLPPTATNDTLRDLFQSCGTVLNAYVAFDRSTGLSRGFGFVDFASPFEAQRAVEKLDKCQLEGKILSVSIKI